MHYADPEQVLAYSPRLYRFREEWVEPGLPVHDGTLEQILELQPDLVITGEFNAVQLRTRLQQLGIAVKVFPLPQDLASIAHYLADFHIMLNHEYSREAGRLPVQFPQRHKRLLLLGANGIGTGQGTMEHDLINAAGWDNYLQQDGYITLALEQIIADPPDAVYWSAPKSRSLANLFAHHPAIRGLRGSNETLNDQNWRWQCPGPWTYDILQELAEWDRE